MSSLKARRSRGARRLGARAWLGLMAALWCVSTPVWAADAKPAEANHWNLTLKDVDIHAFIEQVAAITGENFVVDPAVKGKVSVVGTPAMTREAVKELFLSVLRVNNYAAIPSGSITRIVPLTNAKSGGMTTDTATPNGQQIVTRVLPVKNANVEDAVKVLKPMVSANGYLEGSVYSNALIVSDYADNVGQIAKTLRSLDQGGETGTEVDVIALKEAWVGNLVPLIENLSPVQLADSKSRNRLRVVADERSNSIIVRGNAKERSQIRHLVETLDAKTPNGSDIQLIHLQYADAREVANLLRGLVFENKQSSGGAPAFAGGANPVTPSLGAAGGNTSTANNALASLLSAGGAGSAGTAAPPLTTEPQDITTQSFIQASVPQNALVVRAEPGVMSEIRRLVQQMDVRRPQVLIEAAIVEITSNQSQQLGVQLAAGDVAQRIRAGSTQFSGAGLPIGAILSQLGNANAATLGQEGASIALGTGSFDVLIQALANTSGVNLLSTPSITTLDNAEARIVVGQNVPFRTGSYSTLNSGVSNPFTTIERQDIGVTLRVVPQIHEGNLVRLTIAQEVSSIAPTNVDTAAAADIVTNKRTIETKVLAEDGETVVLGGLMQDDTAQSVSKIPLLGDIPFLGALFRYSSTSAIKRNLLVFLRPSVLRGREAMANVAQEHYGRLYDLQLGEKKDAALQAGTYHVPAVDTVFAPEPKTLPWLLPEAHQLPGVAE